MTPYDELARRALPPLRPREEMLDILQREVYGYLPTDPCTVTASEPTKVTTCFMRNTVHHTYVTLALALPRGEYSFRVDRLLHTDGKKRPLIIFLSFRPMGATPYFAIEEMSEREVDFLCVDYRDITSDDQDFTNGIAPLFLPKGQNHPSAPGKIAMWAYAAMRILDYGLTLPGTDPEAIGIAGHSRLGKTAMLAAAMDERFRFALVNNAGCGGDALAHGNSGHSRPEGVPAWPNYGEMYSNMLSSFPYWGCPSFLRHTQRNLADEFDQHYLLAAIAPRYSFHCAAEMDLWADPVSQYLCTVAASPVFEAAGVVGMTDPDRYPVPGEVRLDGHIGFYYAPTPHFLGRRTWNYFIDYILAHKNRA